MTDIPEMYVIVTDTTDQEARLSTNSKGYMKQHSMEGIGAGKLLQLRKDGSMEQGTSSSPAIQRRE